MRNPIYSSILAFMCAIPFSRSIAAISIDTGLGLVVFLGMLTGLFIGISLNNIFIIFDDRKKAKNIQALITGFLKGLGEDKDDK